MAKYTSGGIKYRRSTFTYRVYMDEGKRIEEEIGKAEEEGYSWHEISIYPLGGQSIHYVVLSTLTDPDTFF